MPRPSLPKLAYLTSLYPAVSHTFIQREITALRDLGFEIETCSMRKPEQSHLTGPEETAAAASTFYILAAARRPATLPLALLDGLMHPARFLRALGLAWRTAPPGTKGHLKQGYYFAEALILARYLKTRGVAHLHNHFADPSATVAMLTSALSGIPFSYTLHGPAELYEPEKWQLREKTARAAFVVCISHFARSQAMYFSDPAHWGKLRIVHCGVLPEIYEQAAPPEHKGTEIIFVGRLTAIKGLRVLLEAFAEARTTRPNLRLTLVGDGDDRSHLERLAAPLGDAVRFAGFLSQGEVAQALATSDVLVLPSFAEGLPVVLMEALASARPVIATQVAGVGELVEDGINGFLVPPGDTSALAERIGRIADHPDLRAQMGMAGREKVKAEFDIRQEAARIGALFVGEGGTAARPTPMRSAD